MSDFERAFDLVIGAEGGYVNDPSDPGGETKYGISKRSFPMLDIKNLTLDSARTIYCADYWNIAHCDDIPWPLNAYVFDTAVNQGVTVAITLLQKTLGVAQDGSFGPQTRKELVLRRDTDIAERYMAERAIRYTGTKNFDRYGRGWFKRMFSLAINTVTPQGAPA